MTKAVLLAVLFSIVAGILQSTVFSHVAFFSAVPDLALGVLVYTAYVNGPVPGQLTGFFSGLLLDFLSAAPLGLNCLVRTVLGAAAGMMKGAFFLDFLVLPMILMASATVVKALAYFILHLIFAPAVPTYSLTSPVLWAELALNTLSAPVLFALLRRVKPLSAVKEK
ncbi:MAG: rod shape-determining protein MreD [Spirochaetes bacterium]|nr:rod shape-determining protein MreD [Spirochaetota bacterium]